MIPLNEEKNKQKWIPVLENMGVKDQERQAWMAEYAEFHSRNENAYGLNENAYANLGNINGMGAVRNPIVAANPGNALGVADFGVNTGSGDYGQQLLPVAMKIAAQTIGLDLVAVKPTPGPKIDLLYIDFQYDDTRLGNADERPQVFKVSGCTNQSTLNAVLAAATGDPGKKNSTGNESINISANALFDKYTEYDSTTT